MNKSKRSKISILILSSIALSFLFLVLSDLKKNHLFKRLRHLDGEDPVWEENISNTINLCKDGNEDIYKHFHMNDYLKEKNKKSGEVIDKYDSNIYKRKDANENGVVFQTVKKLMGGDGFDTGKIVDIILEFKLYLIFMIFGIVSLFGWIGCCICCCCPCCCCRQKGNENGCRKFSLIMMFLCILSVLGLSAYGLNSAYKVTQDFYSLTCSLLSTFITVVKGEQKQEFPKWDGITGITDILGNITDAIEQVKTNMEVHLDDKKLLDDESDNFNSAITNKSTELLTSEDIKFETFYMFTLKEGVNTYRPDYLEFVANISDPNSIYYKINDAYNQLIDISYEILSTSDEASKNIKEQATDYTSSINDVKDTLVDLDSKFGDIFSDYASFIFDYKEYITKYVNLGLTLFFGIFVGISALITLFSLFYVCCKCGCAKVFACIFWNLSVFLLFLNFFLAGLIGIVGKISIEASNVLRFMLSKKNLDPNGEQFLIQDKVAENINTCLNGDGNLGSTYDFNNYTEPMNKLYNLKDNLTTIIEEIDKKSNSADITEKENELEKNMTFEYISFYTLGVANAMNEELEQQDCDNRKDKWVGSKDSCGVTPYTEDIEIMEDDAKCFVFSEHKSTAENYFVTRYKGSSCSVFKNTMERSEFIKENVQYANKIIDENKIIFDKVKEYDQDLMDQFKTVFDLLKSNLKTQKENIDILVKSLDTYFKTGKIEDILNCKFIGTNFGIVLDLFEDGFGALFLKTGAILGSISFLLDTSIIFLIVVLNRYKKETPVDQEGDKEKDPNNPQNGEEGEEGEQDDSIEEIPNDGPYPQLPNGQPIFNECYGYSSDQRCLNNQADRIIVQANATPSNNQSSTYYGNNRGYEVPKKLKHKKEEYPEITAENLNDLEDQDESLHN